MSVSTLTRPISVEQMAEAIKQMSQTEIQRLLDLVPKLRRTARRQTRTQEQIEASVAAVHAELMEALNHQPVSGDEPFLSGLTLNEYLALPDAEQGRIWDEAAEIDWDDLEEMEVRPARHYASRSQRWRSRWW